MTQRVVDRNPAREAGGERQGWMERELAADKLALESSGVTSANVLRRTKLLANRLTGLLASYNNTVHITATALIAAPVGEHGNEANDAYYNNLDNNHDHNYKNDKMEWRIVV